MNWRKILDLTLFDQRGEYDFDLGGVTESGGGGSYTPDPSGFSLGREIGSFTPSLASVASDATSGGGAQPGFWKTLFGSLPKGDQEGSGVLGALSDVGSFAKGVLPIAGVGATLMGALSARDAAKSLSRQSTNVERGSAAQLEAAKQAQALAPVAAAEQPKIDAATDKIGPLAERVAGLSPNIAQIAGRVRAGVTDPSIAFGQQQLERASAGQLDAASEEQFAQAEAAEKADMEAYLGRSGQGESSQRQELLGQITRKYQALRAQAIQNQEGLALKALEEGRAGGATETTILGAEGASDALSASLLGEQARGFATGANVVGTAGGVLSGAAQDARGATAAAQAEEQQLEALIAAANKAVADMTARAG